MKPIKWTKEKVMELGSLYKGPSEFKKANPSAYKALRRYGLCTILYPVENREREPQFTKEKLLELMSQCSSRSEFQKKHASAYNAARKLGIIAEGLPVSHKFKMCGRNPYTDEELILEARKYNTIKDWAEKDYNTYQVACRRGITAKYGPKPLQGTSTGEMELREFLMSLVPDFCPKRFANDYGLDCYSPSLQLGVEYNGLYWHSEEQKNKDYHLNKTKYFEEKGIRIIHVWEHEWRDRKQQVKNYLMSACKVNTNRIGARKCVFEDLPSEVARDFLDKNHIQGSARVIDYAVGCFYQGVLISVATFGPHHRNRDDVKILNRFACNPGYTVQGGLAKMTKMAYEKLGPLKSWADYCKSQGNGYVSAGWKIIGRLPPDYFYGDPYARHYSKQSRQKKKVHTPANMTEREHAKQDGLFRVWDCGKIVLVYDPDNKASQHLIAA